VQLPDANPVDPAQRADFLAKAAVALQGLEPPPPLPPATTASAGPARLDGRPAAGAM